MLRLRWILFSALLGLTAIGSRYGRSIEASGAVHVDGLRPEAFTYRNWRPVTETLGPSDLNLLQPDAAVIRRFNAPNHNWAELAVVAGHRKRSVHTPAFCMSGSGWETLITVSATLKLPGRTVPVTQAVMQQNGSRIVVTYFFTDGDYCTNSLLRFQGVQILKRFRQSVPVGALVRIIVPARSAKEALDTTNSFATAMVPQVLSALRSAKVTG